MTIYSSTGNIILVYLSIYLPILSNKTYARQAAILGKLNIKKGDVTNIQRLKIKQVRIHVRFKSKSMVIFYDEM